MATHLVVTQPFAGYVRGDRITDPAIVDAVLNSESAHSVTPVTGADTPEVISGPPHNEPAPAAHDTEA